MKIIEKIKEIYAQWKKQRMEKREEEYRYMAKQYCCMSDRCCVPCIVVGNVPLYDVSDNKTDLAQFTVNIKDVEHVINTIRVKYIVKQKED